MHGLRIPGWSHGIRFRSIRVNSSGGFSVKWILLSALVLSFTQGFIDSPVTGETYAGVYFGFTDSSGELILIHSPELIELPEQLFAVLPSGELYGLEFIEYREGEQDNNHRQTAYWYTGQENLLVEVLFDGGDDTLLYNYNWDTGAVRSVRTDVASSTSGALSSLVSHLKLIGTMDLYASTFAGIKSSF